MPCELGGRQRQGPGHADPWRHKLALGTLLVEKEPVLVYEVERYQLDIAGLTSTHTVPSLEPNLVEVTEVV